MPKGKFSPYLGARINATFFFDGDSGTRFSDIDYTHEISYSFQAGLDIKLNERWSVNMDVKKVFVSTDISVNGGVATVPDTDLDPLIIGVGFGCRF